VGGLTLGGGISYFSPRYGWTCDAVSNFQIVLADGSIINANAKSHADLFFALKGGNNNFGIVTRIDLDTFAQGPLWAATVYNSFSIVDDVIREFVKVNSRDAYDEYASYFTTFGYSQAQGMGVISNQLEYTKAVENPPVYEGYLSLPNLRLTTQITNMTDLSKQTAALQPTHARYVTPNSIFTTKILLT
jgi:FAD/FMN-containing dehydrogenase